MPIPTGAAMSAWCRADPAAELRPAQHGRHGLRAGSDDAVHRDALHDAGLAVGADLSVHGAQHEMRDRPLRPLPVRPDLRLQGWPGDALRPDRGILPCGRSEMAAKRSRGSRSGSSPPATAASSRCSIARTNCWPWPSAIDIAYFPEASSAMAKGPTICRWSKDRSRRRTTPSASARCAGSRSSWSRSAPARPRAASRRCAISRMSTEFVAAVYASPQYIKTLATSTADLRPREGGFRAARLPDQQGAAPGGDLAPSLPAASRRSQPIASASSASCAAMSASWCRARPASGR